MSGDELAAEQAAALSDDELLAEIKKLDDSGELSDDELLRIGRDVEADELEAVEKDRQHEAMKKRMEYSPKLPKGMTKKQAGSYAMIDPNITAAMQVTIWSAFNFDVNDDNAPDLATLAEAIEERAKALAESDSLAEIEKMLVAQALTLDIVGNSMLMRAKQAEYLNQIDTYAKHGLRALSQSRAVLETLATIKRPIIKQTNIAHGPQQVNTHVGKTEGPNQLSASRGDVPLEAVATFDRPKITRR
jgi:hypothetical protein